MPRGADTDRRSVWDTACSHVGSGSETQTREAFRRFILTGISPLAIIVSRELTRVFEVPVELDLDALAYVDLAGKARAYKSLLASGVSAADAALFTGVGV